MQPDDTHHGTTVAGDPRETRRFDTGALGLRGVARTADATGTTTDRRDARPEASGRTVEALTDGGMGE